MKSLNVINETVGEIVARNFNTAAVFEKYGIDFCCGGKKDMQTACAEHNLNYETVCREVEEAANTLLPSSQNANNWALPFLTAFITQTHHQYVNDSIPVLLKYTQKIASVHGKNHPELITVAQLFITLSDELLQHMQKEEQVLFPYINNLYSAYQNKAMPPNAQFGTVANPLRVLENEHEIAGNLMQQIKDLTQNYTLPSDACNTYGVTFARLHEFETDLHRHVHLENNILFPKALALEQEITV